MSSFVVKVTSAAFFDTSTMSYYVCSRVALYFHTIYMYIGGKHCCFLRNLMIIVLLKRCVRILASFWCSESPMRLFRRNRWHVWFKQFTTHYEYLSVDKVSFREIGQKQFLPVVIDSQTKAVSSLQIVFFELWTIK